MNDQLASACLHGAFTYTNSLNSFNSPMKVTVFIFTLQIRKLRLTKSGYHPLKPHRATKCQSWGWNPFFSCPTSTHPSYNHHLSGWVSCKAARVVLGFQEQSKLQAPSLLELIPVHRGLFLGH